MLNFKRHRDETFIVYSLLALYLFAALAWQDISLSNFDDAMYLESGRHLHAAMFFSDLTSMPLYALWFKLLFYLFPNPITCHFVSWGILVVLVSVLPRIFKVPGAWLYTILVLLSQIFAVTPYVSLFASMFLLLGMLIVRARGLSYISSGALACFFCLLVAYSRPEYSYGVFLSAAVVLAGFFLKEVRAESQFPLGGVLAAAVVAAAMFYVVAHSDSGRSGVAFAQHFNERAANHGVIPVAGAWDSAYAYQVFGLVPAGATAESFGEHSIGEFFKANPKLFLTHCLKNLESPLTLLFLFATMTAVVWPFLRERDRHLRPASRYLFLVAAPTMISLVIVYPEKHYVAIVLPTLIFFVTQLATPAWQVKIASAKWVLYAAAVLSVAMFTVHKVRVVAKGKGSLHPGTQTLECLRSLEESQQPRNSTIFDPLDVKDVYLVSPKTHIEPTKITNWPEFQTWTKQTKPGWVLITPDLLVQYGEPRAEVDSFLRGNLGYVPHACPAGTDVVVYSPQGN